MKLTRAEERNRAWPGLLLVFLALCFPQASGAQTAVEQILAETDRLEKVLARLKLSDEETRLRAAALSSVKQNLQAGRLHLGLYRLHSLWVEIMAQDYAAAKASIEQKGAEAFEAEWQRLGLELDEKEKRLAALKANAGPSAIAALSESALTQVRPYYRSGRLYGLNTTIRNGLFYMGLAPANLDFAILCRGLRLEPQGRPLKLRSLNAELLKLEAMVVESFRRMDSSDTQPQFIRLNSTLKMAVELDKEGRYAGVLLKYLEAALLLNLLTPPQADAKGLPRLTEQSRVAESRLKRAGAEHSIALIYLEMAQAAMDEAAAERLDAERFKRAAIIIESVLPLYFEITSGDK